MVKWQKNNSRLSFFFLSGRLICLFIWLSISQGISQAPFFKRIYLNRDNSNFKANVIYRDNQGFIWLGTSEGLYQYDGIEQTLYVLNPKNYDNNVTAIFQDHQNNFWVGYKNGLIARIINDSLKIFNPEEGLPKKSITHIAEDNNGVLWFSTSGEGIYYFLNNRIYNINTNDGLNDDYAYVIAKDSKGQMWVGTDKGIGICTLVNGKKKIERIGIENGLPDNIVREIIPDREGNLWIGMQDKGVCQYILKENKIYVPNAFSKWKYGQVNCLMTDGSGLWIGTEEEGVVFLDSRYGNRLDHYIEFNSVRINRVSSLLPDKEGNSWIVANSSIYQSTGNRLMFLQDDRNNSFNFIHCIYCDKKNNLWFTPDQGLVRYALNDSKINKVTRFVITLPEERIDIVSLFEDPCGYIWIGTMGKGLWRLNPATGKKQCISGDLLLDKGSILSITGKDNVIWAATFGGALKLTLPDDCNSDIIKPKIENYSHEPILGDYFIYTIYIDSKKRVWFGTDGKGLVCLENGQFRNYTLENGLKSNTINAITEDEGGRIWFSTLNSGIYKLDENKFTNYALNEGIRYLSIASLMSDRNGNLLIVHNNGLDVMNIENGNFIYYGSEVGLQDINPDNNAITKDNEGHIWLGTETGIIRYFNDGDQFRISPGTVLSRISISLTRPVSSAQHDFSYSENDISFDFKGLWYSSPDRVRYQYQLSGYNENWINTKDRRVIYSNLPPGKYIFKIRTSLNRQFTSESEVSYSFSIAPPFWQTTWFIIIVLLLIISGAYLFFNWRIKDVRKVERLKKETLEFQFETLRSQVNPHFLFNSFNTLISIIEDDREIAVEYVEKLSEFFRNIVNYRDKNLITLKEELNLVSSYIFLQQKRYSKNFSITFDIKPDKLNYQVPPLVLQILLENVFKHNAISHETPLEIIIFTNESDNRLTIQNSINKKRNLETGTGTGLHNIISRFKLLVEDDVIVRHDLKIFSVSIPLIYKK